MPLLNMNASNLACNNIKKLMNMMGPDKNTK